MFCSVGSAISLGQERQRPSGPRIDLLTMNGSKPNLDPKGEGISSYKVDDLFQLGTTRVTLLKGDIPGLKMELPIGYRLYNNLVYVVETNAVFSGWSDITFNLPSASSKQSFEQLRILYPKIDYADPKVPKWIDATFTETSAVNFKGWMTDDGVRRRLPNFGSRCLHAFAQPAPRILLVAVRDPDKARDKLHVDLSLTGTGTQQVTEGQLVTYDLKLTNNGPDAATNISLEAYATGFSFVSVTASQGRCRMAGNVYCKFPSLEKNRTIGVKIVEQCAWNSHSYNVLPIDGRPGSVQKIISVTSAERDSVTGNNELEFATEVYPDPNKGPVIEILSPSLFQRFQGPRPRVSIRFKASDPDGMVSKLELFEEGHALGIPNLISAGEYEFIYRPSGFGSHWVKVVATDNLGRISSEQTGEIFVNGTAKVEIVNPKSGNKLKREDSPFTVTIHASSGASPIKKVSLDFWNSDAKPVGNDEYVVAVNNCSHDCRLQAIAIDEKGIETRSDYLDLTVVETPEVTLAWFDDEYSHLFENQQTLKATDLELVSFATIKSGRFDAKIVKSEFFANGELICTDTPDVRFHTSCYWQNIKPGQYKLYAVSTDADGQVGRSREITVIIERP